MPFFKLEPMQFYCQSVFTDIVTIEIQNIIRGGTQK